MKIDHVVLDPHNHSIQKLIVSAKDGAVRWISGNSMSGAYQIDTPHAIITDEGTAFDLVVEPQRTLVLLHTGRVTVCAIHAPGRCKPLSRRGEMVLATTDDVVGPWESGVEPSGFETQCLNAKCTIAAFAPPPPQSPSDGDRKAPERPPEPHHAVAPSDGDRKGPERPPEPHHAVAPSPSDTGKTVVPSRPEKREATVPSAPQVREVAVPSAPQIHEIDVPRLRGHGNLWLYVQPSQPGKPGSRGGSYGSGSGGSPGGPLGGSIGHGSGGSPGGPLGGSIGHGSGGPGGLLGGLIGHGSGGPGGPLGGLIGHGSGGPGGPLGGSIGHGSGGPPPQQQQQGYQTR